MIKPTIAELYADWANSLNPADLPSAVVTTAQRLLLDSTGLCVAARQSDYIAALLASIDGSGICTAISHAHPLDATNAALLNGTAIHGEDFDDTFEGTPVHAGAVIIPAVLAACERYNSSGQDALRGIVAGAELMCRMALVTPTAIHRAGFHPTAVIGTLGATLAVATALKLNPREITHALGIAGSLASGIIEYLAEGTWTKRLHAGWAAQSGIRAALLGKAGFTGPRSVFEGQHGFFHAFTNADVEPDFKPLTENLGTDWLLQRIAFKPYACGTMAQPFIDCALQIRNVIDLSQIDRIDCKVGEGTVHRLWEPLAEKRKPSTAYSAKFSVPYCIVVALLEGAAGLDQFSEEKINHPDVLALAERIAYKIDPTNEYPRNYSGHLRIQLNKGRVEEITQPYLRGGVREPLSENELLAKFRANTAYGGWSPEQTSRCENLLQKLFVADNLNDLRLLRE